MNSLVPFVALPVASIRPAITGAIPARADDFAGPRYNGGMASSDQPSRRDFLHGRVAAGLLGGVARIFADQPGFIDARHCRLRTPATLLASYRRRAMACEFEVQLPAADSGRLTESVLAALDLLEVIEAQLTVYRADSELLRINRQAAERPVNVESRLFALLQMAARLHLETDGALDITSGPLSDAWGFSRREGRMPSDEEIAAALATRRNGQSHPRRGSPNSRLPTSQAFRSTSIASAKATRSTAWPHFSTPTRPAIICSTAAAAASWRAAPAPAAIDRAGPSACPTRSGPASASVNSISSTRRLAPLARRRNHSSTKASAMAISSIRVQAIL